MPNDLHPTQSGGAGGEMSPPDDFLSLRDILAMLLRHRRLIAAVVLLATLAAGAFFLLQPRMYQAEGYFQMIAPVAFEGRVDQNQFEIMILSHLQRASSAFIAKNVAGTLKAEGIDILPVELKNRVKITRPPKTDLIRLVANGKTEKSALLIVRQWIRYYLESVQHNNIRTALSQVSLLLKQTQTDCMETQAAVDKIKAQVLLTAPLITVSRAVDDRQLWGDLTRPIAPDPEALKKLAGIHIKGQEQNSEYINLKNAVNGAEQGLASALVRRDLYREVERLLEARVTMNGNSPAGNPASTNAALSEAEIYLKMVLKNVEIIQFGEPGLLSSSRGALKKTGLFFLAALVIMCVGVFGYEWGKGILA